MVSWLKKCIRSGTVAVIPVNSEYRDISSVGAYMTPETASWCDYIM